MLRRVLAASLAALIVVGCGGSTPTAAPSSAAPSSAAPPASPPASTPEAPAVSPTAAPSTAPTTSITKTAACGAIGLRKSASAKAVLISRIASGTTVHVIDIVTGDAYTVGSCGTAGNTWYAIDQVNGKAAQTLYGLPYVYSAAGMYQ